ncbi:multidrug efflux SMR transporter [Jatrophihabitans telluris]|uniref:Multidrug efflux SMR transporter n=1 Tax=Jatrophihabitans telluris TaxID=2038343 RepID=A0ABY4QZK1_9ACTN|nr:multidrug efflux SMR transporter [Jatrophihabitans telluris]UQX88284.1 multidrug efflux SMR transporter [Jatrophihabitans telluris]
MGWVFLALAIGLEIVGTVSLKYTNGFRVLGPSVIVAVGYGLSFYFLSLALKRHVPLSSAYAIWSAVGTAAIAVIGVLVFDEKVTALKVAGIAAVILGVVAINASGAGH